MPRIKPNGDVVNCTGKVIGHKTLDPFCTGRMGSCVKELRFLPFSFHGPFIDMLNEGITESSKSKAVEKIREEFTYWLRYGKKGGGCFGSADDPYSEFDTALRDVRSVIEKENEKVPFGCLEELQETVKKYDDKELLKKTIDEIEAKVKRVLELHRLVGNVQGDGNASEHAD